MKKAYFGAEGQQIHYRELAARHETENLPLLCLAPSPHSSLNFTSIMPLLNQHRRVIAVDYPGFGGSDPLDETPSIESYAKSLRPFIESLGRVDTISFHSGTLVNLELSLTCPDLMANIIMIDVAYFEAEIRAKYDKIMGGVAAFPNTLEDISKDFEGNYAKKIEDLGHARAYDMWAEYMRAGEGRNAVFHAAFTYDCEVKFPALKRPVNVIATQSSLLEPTRKAAQIMPNASLVEILGVTRAVFELGKEKTSEKILAFLS